VQWLAFIFRAEVLLVLEQGEPFQQVMHRLERGLEGKARTLAIVCLFASIASASSRSHYYSKLK
jgi:hypothetical protein